jgi:hypothetical protein
VDRLGSAGEICSILTRRPINSSSSRRICVRASAAPRQKCGPPPKARCGFGGPADVETQRVGEHPLVEVGRGVPEDHAVTPPDEPVAEHRVLGCGAAHVQRGRAPPQHLLDGPIEQRGFGGEPSPFRRIGGEGEQAVAERAAHGLGSGDHQQHHEHVVLDVGQPAVVAGRQQRTGEVVPRLAPVLLGEPLGVAEELRLGGQGRWAGVGGQPELAGRAEFRVVMGQNEITQPLEPFPVGGIAHPDQIEDHPGRNRFGDVRDQLRTGLGGAGPVYDLTGVAADPFPDARDDP